METTERHTRETVVSDAIYTKFKVAKRVHVVEIRVRPPPVV